MEVVAGGELGVVGWVVEVPHEGGGVEEVDGGNAEGDGGASSFQFSGGAGCGFGEVLYGH